MINQYQVEADFCTDWVNFLKGELNNWGCTIEEHEDPETVSFKYFNLRKRRIQTSAREVLVSKEFVCPSEHLSGLELIKNRIRTGEDLTPYLSKTVLTDPSYNDGLINDWDIHHLHLGILPDSRDNRLIERTGPLLYARFDDRYAYLINVLSHGEWTNKDLILVIHNNWPNSIDHDRVKNIVEIEPLSDVKEYREAGIQTMTSIADGILYSPIGGGYTTSGLSAEVVKISDDFFTLMRDLQNNLKITKLVSDAKAEGISLPEKLHLKLVVQTGKIYAEEQISKFKWPIANLDNW